MTGNIGSEFQISKIDEKLKWQPEAGEALKTDLIFTRWGGGGREESID